MFHNPVELSDILELCKLSHVPEIANGFDRPLSVEDYQLYKQSCEKNVMQLNSNLGYLEDTESSCLALMKDNELLLAHLLILCGEHSGYFIWTSTVSFALADELKIKVLRLCGEQSLNALLSARGCAIFTTSIIILRPKLLSSSWKCNPAAVECYCWMLMHMKAPYLDELLNDVLPTALIITDDFESFNRIKGLNCITHIIENVTKANLELYGEDEVILGALRPILYHHESEVLEPLLLCFISLMRKIYRFKSDLTRDKFDDVVDIILNNLTLEENDESKIIYLKMLSDLLQVLQLRALRYARNIYEMAARELRLETSVTIKQLWLEVLNSTMRVSWPGINTRRDGFPLLLTLLKLIYDCSFNENKNTCNDLVASIKNSLRLIKCLFGDELESIREEITNCEEMDDRFKNMIGSILD